MSKNFDFKVIILEPVAGASLYRCQDEAIVIAGIFNCRVQFIHNGQKFLVEKNGDVTKKMV
jgi:hypothetical protein